MSKRSDRREAERQARRLNYLQSQNTTAAAAAQPAPKPESSAISEAQLNANRANAQHSTGATSPAGKARSSMNALKHGLTSKTVVLPGEDKADYEARLETLIAAYQPATEDELLLVKSILDCEWRLDRITQIETSIYFKGELEFKAKFEDRPELERFHLIKAETYLKYEKPIRNLNVQEARLRRTMDKTKLELRKIQSIRFQQEFVAQQAQAKAAKSAPARPQPQNGFDFSTNETPHPTNHENLAFTQQAT
jgi:hypothetical protein